MNTETSQHTEGQASVYNIPGQAVPPDQHPQGRSRPSSIRDWWYRFTAPSEPADSAPLRQREAARRGRLASTTLFWVTIFTLAPLPVGLISHNIPMIALLFITLLVNGIALALNRSGQLTLAGLLVVIILGGGIAFSLVMNPGGLDVGNLPTFDLLAESTLVAVAFFPPWSVFVVIGVNCLFIITDLMLERHSTALDVLLSTSTYDVLVRPVILQAFVGVVVYLWVRSALQAIARADRAEVIAELLRREQEQQEKELELKRQLDTGIQQILETHVQVAQGNFTVRAPLAQDNILWRIAYSLNNLLARLQRYGQIEAQQRHLHGEIERLLAAIHAAKKQQIPIPAWRGGTPLDLIIAELSQASSGLREQGGSSTSTPKAPRKE